GKNRAIAGAPLHAGFSLTAGGEYLALVRPAGATIATEFAPLSPRQQSDTSYGLAQDVATTFRVSNTSPVRVFVPSNDIGRAWTSNSFNDVSWLAGTNGVGYQ